MLTGSIPDGIGKLTTLKYFYAYTNRIIGGTAVTWNEWIFRRMYLKGTIPKEAIGFCSSATALSFASNGLTGALPITTRDRKLQTSQLFGCIKQQTSWGNSKLS
ncbi:hypothetical protein V6N13_014103 [Hibiscus sabdariffa]|uniref:Uncharacterized protein n=1 Tax=Hibiscus sabdariffa TaxID=183260 RepID=A0ABR2RV29_9ROSI